MSGLWDDARLRCAVARRSGRCVHFNAFGVLVLVPLALGYFALCFQRALKDEGFRWPNIPPSATIALFALAAVFTLFRNL